MTEPLISVVIPAYNVERFIEEAIVSVANQTYKNLEIIVVDDASTDDTFKVLQKLADTDSRIRLFRNAKNKRIAETLNFGVEQATGTFIARMDGDDICFPDKIQAQYDFLIQNPEIDLVSINVIMVDEDGKEIHKETYLSEPESIKVASRFVSPVGHFWLTRKTVYEKIGKYRIPSAEDLDFILRALDHGLKLYNLPEYLYLQRQRSGNTATALGLTQIKSIAYVRKLQQERLQNKLLTDSYSPENLLEALKTTWFEKKRFNISSKYHFKYVQYKNKNKLLALAFRSVALTFSPLHQLTPMYNRWRYKKLKKAGYTNLELNSKQ